MKVISSWYPPCFLELYLRSYRTSMIQRQPPAVFLKKSVLNYFARFPTLLKKKLWHRCFPVKVLRTHFYRTVSSDCLWWWTFFAKIINSFYLLTIFAKGLHHRCSTGSLCFPDTLLFNKLNQIFHMNLLCSVNSFMTEAVIIC